MLDPPVSCADRSSGTTGPSDRSCAGVAQRLRAAPTPPVDRRRRPVASRPRSPTAAARCARPTAGRPLPPPAPRSRRRPVAPAAADCWCSPSTESDWLRRTAEDRTAVSPAALPRLTSRPPSASTRGAAAAATPKTGSSTTSASRRRPRAGFGQVAFVRRCWEPDKASGAASGDPGCCSFGPADGDHAAGAERPGGADGRLTDRAAGAQHDHRLARLQAGPPAQRHPGGHPGEPDGRHRSVRQRAARSDDVGSATEHCSARLPSPGTSRPGW